MMAIAKQETCKGQTMKSEFLQPQFDGARFTEHTLPLDVAKDLAAYETLIVELAKRLYLNDHPERQRVPKGFGADFHLHLDRIEDGSSRPVLSIVTAGALALGGCFTHYFENAREVITECVAAPQGQLPAAFPAELLGYFNQVGRSLQQGESMSLPSSNGPNATLTPERRKLLVLAADQVYEREIELTGTIEEVDWERATFRMRLTDGSKATVPMPDSFQAAARRCGGRPRHQVTVRGVGTYDSWDKLQKVLSVESPLEVQEDFQIAARFDEIRSLQDGWFDNQGQALDVAKLDRIADSLIGHYPEKLPLPAIIPTPEGNLLLEWDTPGNPSVDISLSDMKAYFHAFRPGQDDVEREFDLVVGPEWSSFLSFLTHSIGQRET